MKNDSLIYRLKDTKTLKGIDSPLAYLVKKLESKCIEHNLNLGRYETKIEGKVKFITWIVYKGDKQTDLKKIDRQNIIASFILNQSSEGLHRGSKAYGYIEMMINSLLPFDTAKACGLEVIEIAFKGDCNNG